LNNKNSKPLCGIDEAGRGPLAGSLVMAGVVLTDEVEGLMDSKKLTQKKREALYPLIIANSRYHIISFSAQEVDEKLQNIMSNIYIHIKKTCDEYDLGMDLISGANMLGFKRVADAMIAQGV